MKTVGIIGGGPAGLSIARMLTELGEFKPTVFEALGQVGGKSFTFQHGSNVVEMGTCYATFSHAITNKWMRELEMKMSPLGEQRFDDDDFMKFVKSGDGPALPVQVARYWKDKLRLERELEKPVPTQSALDDAALPAQEWLARRKLGKIQNFMLRSTTNIAYGFIDEVPAVQALRWNDMKLIFSGLLKQLKMPVAGWAEFWRLIASDLDVRLNSPVTGVDRSGEKVVITTGADSEHEFDFIVCAIPVDDFIGLTKPTDLEQHIADSVEWNGYTTTLFAAENWFDDVHVVAFRDSVMPGAELGQLLSARREGSEPELGGDLYLAGQLTGNYSGPELAELLRADVKKYGGNVTNVILQKLWKYFAQYDSDAIRGGLLSDLKKIQGQNRTWYTGAIFSHEAVSHIVTFNSGLARQIQKNV
ncbi:FAD-dependent oxidoreductase [Henriciella litoralis]|uniref:FAD-dependent oxidoreductase n=1 Tax=Henriciella litoralis TaxID=568102 RepID=UPI00111C6B72|nr:FAD-dependent oxidoreductase [Henriciella litoralis]